MGRVLAAALALAWLSLLSGCGEHPNAYDTSSGKEAFREQSRSHEQLTPSELPGLRPGE